MAGAVNIIYQQFRAKLTESLDRKNWTIWMAVLFLITTLILFYFWLRKIQRQCEQFYKAWEQHSPSSLSVNEKTITSVRHENRVPGRQSNWDSTERCTLHDSESSSTVLYNECHQRDRRRLPMKETNPAHIQALSLNKFHEQLQEAKHIYQSEIDQRKADEKWKLHRQKFDKENTKLYEVPSLPREYNFKRRDISDFCESDDENNLYFPETNPGSTPTDIRIPGMPKTKVLIAKGPGDEYRLRNVNSIRLRDYPPLVRKER